MFPKEDSNPHNQNQNLKCYHYTIGECNVKVNIHQLALFVNSRTHKILLQCFIFCRIIVIERHTHLGKIRMNIHNIMEEHVIERVNELYDNLGAQKPAIMSCDCRNCRLDTATYVLNRIPPRYIVSGRGVAHLNADHAADQLRADMDALIIEGIRLINSAKRPYHRQGKHAPAVRESSTPLYNFPIFAGQIFDGSTFEPLGNASVRLLLNGKPAPMQDVSWSNPCPTFASTHGNYTFWVKPQAEAAAGMHKDFHFTIKIDAPDYAGTSYSFEVPLTSETADRSELNSRYSLKIQDLFLFRDDVHNPMED